MTVLKEVNEKVYKIIGACMEVHRNLGPGYPVDFYRRALEVELPSKKIPFESRKTLQVIFKDVLVGTLGIDFLIDKSVISEVLNLRKLQPVIRHIILKGNTRNNRSSNENKKMIFFLKSYFH